MAEQTTASAPTMDDTVILIPVEPKARQAFLKKHIVETIGRKYSIRHKKVSDELMKGALKGPPLTEEERRFLYQMLLVISNLDLTSAMEKDLNLKRTLSIIMDEDSITPQYEYPQIFAKMARETYLKFEAENWGANAVAELSDEDEDDQTNATPISPSASKKPRLSNISSKEEADILCPRYIRRPKPNHPIYGTEGIMRGILVDTTGKMRTYFFDDTYPRRSHKVFGRNGLKIGDWWPLQLCALRDGAHGVKMGGIAGTETQGATSIVVSGTYADLDTDLGSILFYSGSDSHSNTNPTTPTVTRFTRALQRSLQTKRPIRVLRTSKGEGKLAPSEGIRYDGLYTITKEEVRKNKLGGAYLRFRLERCEGQDDIDMGRPTRDERKAFDKVREGY